MGVSDSYHTVDIRVEVPARRVLYHSAAPITFSAEFLREVPGRFCIFGQKA